MCLTICGTFVQISSWHAFVWVSYDRLYRGALYSYLHEFLSIGNVFLTCGKFCVNLTSRIGYIFCSGRAKFKLGGVISPRKCIYWDLSFPFLALTHAFYSFYSIDLARGCVLFVTGNPR